MITGADSQALQLANDQNGSRAFLRRLLAQQSDLSAVEEFAAKAESLNSDSPAQAKYYENLLPTSTPAAGEQYAFKVDLDKCSGCKSCVVACHSLNGLEEDESWRRVGTITIGDDQPELRYYSSSCHHCDDPGCLNGCPVLAYDKDPVTGIVKHLDDQCIGCKYCTMMCPYEVPTYNKRLGIVRKCDMCTQRLATGEAPACVQACPNEAIEIKCIARPNESEVGAGCIAPGAPPSNITRPSTQYVSQTPVDELAAAAQNEWIDKPAESHWPLVALLVGTQASVGVLGFYLLCIPFIDAQIDIPVLVTAFTLALVGLILAPLHLGQPTRSWRIFLGLRRSWLSREGVILGLYSALLGTLLLSASLSAIPAFEWLPSVTESSVTKMLFAAITLLAGLGGLFSSAMIYIATRRVLWRASRTVPLFAGTAITLGCAWLSVALLFSQPSPRMTSLTCIALAAVAYLAKLTLEPRLFPKESDAAELALRCQALLRGPLASETSLRFRTSTAGIVSLIFGALCLALNWDSASIVATLLGASLLTGAEFLERLLYFKSVVYPRMPGVIR